MRRRLTVLLTLSVLGSIALACSGEAETPDQPEGTGETPSTEGEVRHGLTPEQAAQTLAKVGDRTITVGELAEEIASKGPFLQARYNSPERRRELLDQMIRFELLAQEADRAGFDDRPDVQRTRKQILIRRFLKQQYEDRIQLSDVSDDDVRQYYEAHAEEFNKPEQVRASHIQLRDRATAQRVLRQILDNPSDVRLFRELSERHNTDDETRDRFGDLRFFSRIEERQPDDPVVPPPVVAAAFSIPAIGGVHPELVQSERGFHVVKLTGRRATLTRSLAEATRPIRHRLWRERRERAVEELVERLHAEADVHEDLSLLSEVQIHAPEGSFPTEQPLPRPDPVTPSTPTLVPVPARGDGARGAGSAGAGSAGAGSAGAGSAGAGSAGTDRPRPRPPG